MTTELKPDFVIIGAMKCGTTTLAAQLGAQPGIFMTEPKEPAFFSHDDIHARGEDWYRSLYEPANAGDIKGEASTEYTKLPTYPKAVARLYAFAPEARLIYITRDPYTRIVSHYMHLWRDGTVPRDINRAIREHPEFIDYSKYDAQLEPWIERFGTDAVLRLTMEEMSSAPQQVLERAARHIGFAGEVSWRDDLDRMNPGVGHLRSFPLKKLLVDNAVMETLRRRLVPRSARLKVRQALGLELTRKPELSDAARAFIAAELEKPITD